VIIMAGIVSIELLDSMIGAPNGIAALDATGLIPVSQLPAGTIETFKGQFATSALLIAAFPTGNVADYAFIDATASYWYWNPFLATPAWVDQTITVAAWTALTALQQGAVPYILTP
jgi:hypothetical protein